MKVYNYSSGNVHTYTMQLLCLSIGYQESGQFSYVDTIHFSCMFFYIIISGLV